MFVYVLYISSTAKIQLVLNYYDDHVQKLWYYCEFHHRAILITAVFQVFQGLLWFRLCKQGPPVESQ